MFHESRVGASPLGHASDALGRMNQVSGIFDFGGLIDGIGDTLEELAIDEGTIKGILVALADGSELIPREEDLKPIPSQSFGTLPAGLEMGLHTGNAHQFLLSSMAEMMAMLGLYGQGVKAFKEGGNAADEFSAAQLRQIHQVVTSATRANEHQQQENYPASRGDS